MSFASAPSGAPYQPIRRGAGWNAAEKSWARVSVKSRRGTKSGGTIADALLYIERIRACSWRQLVALQFLQAGERAQERERIVAAGQEGDIDIAPALSAEFSELGLTWN
jgi:hypothetical protein